jgi:hypothetical protein
MELYVTVHERPSAAIKKMKGDQIHSNKGTGVIRERIISESHELNSWF